MAKIRKVAQYAQLSLLLTDLLLNFTHVLLNMTKCEHFQTTAPAHQREAIWIVVSVIIILPIPNALMHW